MRTEQMTAAAASFRHHRKKTELFRPAGQVVPPEPVGNRGAAGAPQCSGRRLAPDLERNTDSKKRWSALVKRGRRPVSSLPAAGRARTAHIVAFRPIGRRNKLPQCGRIVRDLNPESHFTESQSLGRPVPMVTE